MPRVVGNKGGAAGAAGLQRRQRLRQAVHITGSLARLAMHSLEARVLKRSIRCTFACLPLGLRALQRSACQALL